MARRRRPPRAGAIGELQPLRIAGQIAVLQAIFYAAALVLTLFTAAVAGTRFGPDLVLGWEGVRGDTTQGWLAAFVWVLDGGFFMSIPIIAFVERSKLVLDFALTMHGLHLFTVTLYTGRVPRNAMWWLAMALSSVLAVGLGTWGCQWRELRPIMFGGKGAGPGADDISSSSSNNNNNNNNSGNENADGASAGPDRDLEQGFSRGRGRGRGRDGGGEYEMVNMKKDEGR